MVNLCWSGWRKLSRHAQRKSSSSLFLAPPLPSSDPFALIHPRNRFPFVFKGFTDRAWQGRCPPTVGTIEDGEGGHPGFWIGMLNDTRADKSEQS
eukprot:1130873-Pyramimonas_sp.AAC.1